MQYKVSNVEKMIGFFIFVALLLVGALLVFNIKEGKLFAKRIRLVMITEKGYGFVKGATVKVNGINAGSIEDISLDNENAVRITISLAYSFAKNIHKDAVAEIIEPLALGSPEINILPGSANALLIDDGEFIKAQASSSLAERLETSFGKIEAIIDEVHKTIEPIRKTTENLESITRKIDKGDGSLGQMVNDKGLYTSAKEAVDSTRTIVEGIKSTKIYVGIDTNYYWKEKVDITRFHLSVVPRESRYFWLGGALVKPASNSSFIMENADTFKVFPEFLVAQKVFDNRLTFRAGLLEGKFGGGIDYDPLFKCRDVLLLSVEARGSYNQSNFDENIDTSLIRAKLRVNFAKYFHFEVGGNNLAEKPAFFAGIGFEYLDEDISKIIGLIGAGK